MRQEMQEEMRRIEPVDEPKLAGESASGLDVDSLDSDHLAIDPEDLQPRAWVRPDRNRLLLAAAIVAGVLLLVFLPPFISVNRYRRQIATSIGNSLGRPVRMDSITLNMLPMPGFTLENFVVAEDPAFGSEPVIQARSVKVALRVWSLWRRRVEFSRITLADPSVNLVHLPDGRWNIESILLQASKIEAAPTAQKGAGDAPRFPYIEATGARVNVKMGLVKMPLALTEAEFALWLPQPRQWRLRLEGHPARTDTAATDTGLVQIQGTLGKAATLQDVPVDLTAEWRAAPLGGVSWVLMGRDAGFRGDMMLRTSLQGTVGRNAIESRLELTGLRRTEFVPQRTLDADVTCRANISDIFHRVSDMRCGLPSEVLADPKAAGATLQGEVPNLWRPATANADLSITGVNASLLLDLLRILSARVSPDLTVTGTLSAKASGWNGAASRIAIDGAKLAIGDAKPFVDGDVGAALSGQQLAIVPLELDLGGPQAASLEAHADRVGYTMHLSGTVLRTRLLDLAKALPQFGDGLEEALPPAPAEGAVEAPIHVDLVSNRGWNGDQTWATSATRPVKSKKNSRR